MSFTALPRGAMGWSAVCDCAISLSYSLTNVHKSNRYEACNRIQTVDFSCKKQWPYAILARAIRHFLFQTDDIEIRYDCGERFHVLLKKCARGIHFGL